MHGAKGTKKAKQAHTVFACLCKAPSRGQHQKPSRPSASCCRKIQEMALTNTAAIIINRNERGVFRSLGLAVLSGRPVGDYMPRRVRNENWKSYLLTDTYAISWYGLCGYKMHYVQCPPSRGFDFTTFKTKLLFKRVRFNEVSL